MDLFDFEVGVRELRHVALNCPYIRRILIEKPSHEVTLESFLEFLRSCPALEIGIFRGVIGHLITQEALVFLASCCKLRCLEVDARLIRPVLERIQETRGFAALECLGVQIEAPAVASLLRLFDGSHSLLRQLSLQIRGSPGWYSLQPFRAAPSQLNNIVLEFPQDTVLSAETLKFLQRFPQAKHLKITGTRGARVQSPDFTDAHFAEIVRGMHELEGLDLKVQCHLTVQSLAALSRHCRSLKEVFLPPAFNFNFHPLTNPSPFPEDDVWFPWLNCFGFGGFNPSPTPHHAGHMSLFNRYCCYFPLSYMSFL